MIHPNLAGSHRWQRPFGLLGICLLMALWLGGGCTPKAIPEGAGQDGGVTDIGGICEGGCSAGEVCNNGKCQLRRVCGCTTDSECAAGDICSDCRCKRKGCGAGCTSDSECKTGEICNDCKCLPAPCGCKSDADCTGPGEVCSNCACQKPCGCASDADCSGGMVCRDCGCYPPEPDCKADADCGKDKVCTAGKCAPKPGGCKTNADCIDASKPICKAGACAPCGTAAECGVGLACVGGRCAQVTAACKGEGGKAPVAKPTFVREIKYTGTSWYASPAVVDLDGDGKKEIVGTFYDVFVWDAQGKELAKIKQGAHHQGRIYAPAVVADLDRDGVMEIVVGGSKCSVAAYEYRNKKLVIKAGWPVKACATRESNVEVRGMAAADLDGDGKIEVAVTTTQNGDGAQVWVFQANGKLYQPKGLTKWKAWPRYNKAKGDGNDADANGCGHGGYGAYGLNVAIGDIDGKAGAEIITTYDNHHIQAFYADGKAVLAAPFFKNRAKECKDARLSWGQFIRWLDPIVEANHYNKQTGDWPHPKSQIWLQWTASPPVVADLDGDGKNEVIGVPNAEKNEPYETQFYAVMALDGAHDPARSGMRHKGWETMPKSGAPQKRPKGYYPPDGIPSPTVVSISGDTKPEVLVPMNDGYVYAFSAAGKRLWRYDYRHGRPLMYASEVVVVDLNKDGSPELLFTTWGAPKDANAGWLVILDASGKLVHDVKLPVGTNGNGAGYPAAPTVADVDGDGSLEILLQSFGNGFHIYTVPGSGEACLLWPTARANWLRNAQGPAYKR